MSYFHHLADMTARGRGQGWLGDNSLRDRRDRKPGHPVYRRGWGNYFRTGNAADKFIQADRYAVFRLRRLMIKKRGRNLHAGQVQEWTEEWFNGHGLHRLRGTVRYPKAA